MKLTINQKSPSVKQKVKEKCSQSADILTLLNSQRKSTNVIFNRIVWCANHHKTVYLSQSALAKATGYSRKTVNEECQRLESLGLLELERRASTYTHIYHLTDFTRENESLITRFFKTFFLFSVILLSSEVRSRADVTQFGYVDLNSYSFFSKQATTADPNSAYYFSPEQWPYQQHYDGKPNEIVNFETFSTWLEPEAAVAEIKKQPNKESSMYSFSQEELQELGKYPKDAVNLANRRFAYAVQNQKTIRDPFRYYVTVCDGWVKDNAAKKTPEKSVIDATRPKTGPRSFYKAPERVVQTDYEWCLAVEPELHKFTLSSHSGLRLTKPLADKRWNLLTSEQQQYIMETVHIDCTCRATREFLSHLQDRDNSSHTLIEWNKKILTSDNKPIMSKQSSIADNLSTLDHISEPLDILDEELYEEVY